MANDRRWSESPPRCYEVLNYGVWEQIMGVWGIKGKNKEVIMPKSNGLLNTLVTYVVPLLWLLYFIVILRATYYCFEGLLRNSA